MANDFDTKKFFYWLISLLAVVVVNSALIMVIWNYVVVKTFPSANIQNLDFASSLAISVLFGLLTGHQSVTQVSLKK